MSPHNPNHVPIYHPKLDVVSYVDPRSVAVWKRSGWKAGTGKTRSAPVAAPAPVEAPHAPAAPATGQDDAASAPSPAPVKEN